MCIYLIKKFGGKIFIFHRDMIFLLEGHRWEHLSTVIQAKREAQNHISGEKFYLLLQTFFFREIFFVGQIHIPETFLGGTSKYTTSCSLGTRSKATLSKCIIVISFCFSCQGGERYQIQNCIPGMRIYPTKICHEKESLQQKLGFSS